MTTSTVAVLLLITYWFLNYGSKGRLQKIKWLAWLYDPKKAILERANLVLLFAAGFGLSAWLSSFVSLLNFPVLGIKLFTVLLWAGVLLFILDCIDGGGIKRSSHGIAFAMPVIAAANAGGLAALIIAASGGINQYAGSLFAGLF